MGFNSQGWKLIFSIGEIAYLINGRRKKKTRKDVSRTQ